MRVRNGTSQDAKQAREALMKKLAELPVRDKSRERMLATKRRRAIANASPAVAPGAAAKS